MTQHSPSLSVAELEVVYDTLAQAIDQVGQDKAPLFLVKLALLNASALGRIDVVTQHIQEALDNL